MENDDLLQYLDWDSAFFGLRIGRATPNRLTPDQFEHLDTLCMQLDIACLYLLVDSADSETIRLAEKTGCNLVDIRVTLDYHLHAAMKTPWQPASPAIRLSSSADIPTLRSIAVANHRDSRFYQDGNFPRERCDELYATWIEKSCTGYADAVLVADRGDRAIGYTSCHIKGNNVGTIGLVGISDTCQGEGFGSRLIAEAINWFKAAGMTKVEVATQGRNIAAQRLYQKCGFLVRRQELWFHKWYQL